MKFIIEVSLKPQEMRKLLGLPDIDGLQKVAIDKIQKKLSKTIDEATDVEYLFKRFLPTGILGSGQFQKIVDAVTQLTSKSSTKGKKASSKIMTQKRKT